MADPQDWLKLELGEADKPVNADAYSAIFASTIEALKAINRRLSSHGAETIQWEVVGAGSSSPIYAVIRGRDQAGDIQYGQEVVDAFTSGVRHLAESNTCPDSFDRDSLTAIKKMRNGAAPYGLQPVFSTPRASRIGVTVSVGTNADHAMKTLRHRKNTFCEYGSLEGYLRDLSGSEDRDKVVITDPHTNLETPCSLNPDKLMQLEEKVRIAWKHRVVITGTITVDRRTRRASRVVADDIRILRDRSELPQMDDLHGINITNGVESSEYIRGLRDAE